MSWEQLAAIYTSNAVMAQEDAEQRPVACPNDGEPLKLGPDERLFCPCGDWREE